MISLPSYRTVSGPGMAEIVIKRSRFIGHAQPVHTEAEAMEFIEAVRIRHKQANHNCFAYIAGERDQYQKASDDGEPAGTAGKPILEVIKHQQLKCVAVVVTRYFGGVMLGAGGLVRAYTDGAVVALAAAKVVVQVLRQPLIVKIDYTWLGKLEYELRQWGVEFSIIDYADQVTFSCMPLSANAETVMTQINEVTSAQAIITKQTPQYVPTHNEQGGNGNS